MLTSTNKFLYLLMGFFLAQCFGNQSYGQYYGLSVDFPYTYPGTRDGIRGISLGFTHPISALPNVGLTVLNFNRREHGSEGFDLDTKAQLNSLNLFTHLPISNFALTLGGGLGNLHTSTKIVGTTGRLETVRVDTPSIIEVFGRLGYPFLYSADAHIGLHFITASGVKLIDGSKTTVSGVKDTADLGGFLFTVGFQVAFGGAKRKGPQLPSLDSSPFKSPGG